MTTRTPPSPPKGTPSVLLKHLTLATGAPGAAATGFKWPVVSGSSQQASGKQATTDVDDTDDEELLGLSKRTRPPPLNMTASVNSVVDAAAGQSLSIRSQTDAVAAACGLKTEEVLRKLDANKAAIEDVLITALAADGRSVNNSTAITALRDELAERNGILLTSWKGCRTSVSVTAVSPTSSWAVCRSLERRLMMQSSKLSCG